MFPRIFVLFSIGVLFPSVAFAQGIQTFLVNIMVFINSTIIPLLFALAFLVFIFNTARYFILGGGKEDQREKARQFALWGIIAFVVMVSIWGIVNILVHGLGFDRDAYVCPDYLLKDGPPCWGGTSAEPPPQVTPGEGIY